MFNVGLLVLIATVAPAAEAQTKWRDWDAFARYFMEPHGRVVDRSADDRSTSEGQAYAMFFALVANDRARFETLFTWTQDNLAKGDLASHLPAWHWGKSKRGMWEVIDENAASDADLWLAYTLIHAGELWNEPRYLNVGLALAETISRQEVAELPDFGPMLLPGPKGFRQPSGIVQLNASYVPLQLLLGLADRMPDAIWKDIALRVPELIQGSSPAGFALDWIAHKGGDSFQPEPVPNGPPMASYDAIRVYLWAGMLHPDTFLRDQVLSAIPGMAQYLRGAEIPPSRVHPDGRVKTADSGVGFSAALIPYLRALKERPALEAQQRRVARERDPSTGLYGKEKLYYDQCLALFATGWAAGQYRFDSRGNLNVLWR